MKRILVLVIPVACALAFSSEARACGGFFCNRPQNPWDPPPVAQTAENVAFTVDRDIATARSTLEAHIQIFYTGPAEKFSWVVPVLEPPTLDVGTNQLFVRLEPLTRPTFSVAWREVGTCQPSFGVQDGARGGGPGGAPAPTGGTSGGAPPVDVLYRGEVGPYDAAVVRSDDPEALKIWLAENGYYLSDEASRLIDVYVAERHYFVALKLVSGKDVREIQPIVLKFDGDSPCVPLRLTAIAAIADLRVNLWVLGSRRAVPRNYLELTVNQARIDWFKRGSNYEDLLKQAANEAGGNAFTTEYAGSTGIMDGQLWRQGQFNLDSLRARTTPPDYMDDIRIQGLPRDGQMLALLRKHIPQPAILADMGITEVQFYNGVRQYWASHRAYFKPFDPIAFTADIESGIVRPLKAAQALFDRHRYMTRLATFISPEEMTKDPMFMFNSTLGAVPNQHVADAALLCGNMQYSRCNAPVRLRLPDGREIDFRSSWSGMACGGSNDQYERSDIDGTPALEQAWSREEAGDGATLYDNRKRIADSVAKHNRALEPVVPSPPRRPGNPMLPPPPGTAEGCGCDLGARSGAGMGGFLSVLGGLMARRWRRRRRQS